MSTFKSKTETDIYISRSNTEVHVRNDRFIPTRLNTRVYPDNMSHTSLEGHKGSVHQQINGNAFAGNANTFQDKCKDPFQCLTDAIKDGDFVTCTQLISYCKIDKLLAIDSHTATSLVVAYATSNAEIVKSWLTSGLTLCEQDTINKENHKAPAHKKVNDDSGAYSTCMNLPKDSPFRQLIADIQAENSSRRTQLISDYEEAIIQKDVFGNSCHYLAIKNKNKEIVQLLCLEKPEAIANDYNENRRFPLKLLVMKDPEKIGMLNHILSKTKEKDNKKDIQALLSPKGSDNDTHYEEIILVIKNALISAAEKKEIKKIRLLQDALNTARDNKSSSCKPSQERHKNIVTDTNGNTLLHIAAKNGLSDIIKYLKEEGYKPESKNNQGEIPLHLAVQNGHDKVVEVLLELSKESVFESDIKWNTALHLAVSGGKEHLVQCILAASDEANTQSTLVPMCGDISTLVPMCGATLCCCGCCDQHKVIDPLLSRDSHGYTPLHLACAKGHLSIAKELFKGRAGYVKKKMVTQTDIKGNSCLHLAVMNGHTQLAALCLANGANAEEKNEQGLFPLHMAVRNGHADIMQLLLSETEKDERMHKSFQHCKKDVIDFFAVQYSTRYDHYKAALIAATEGGISDTVKALYGHMSDAKYLCKNIKDENGNTLLHIAANEGHVEIVKYLLENNHDIKSTNSNGQIPLHLAVNQGHDVTHNDVLFETVELLLKQDKMAKSVYTRDNSGSTPFHLAVSSSHLKVVEFLLQTCARGDKDAPHRSHSMTSKNSEHAVTAGQTINSLADLLVAGDVQGSIPLHLACAIGQYDIANILLKVEAAIVAKMIVQPDDYGNTCLHIAIMNGHTKIVQLCLEKDADIYAYNNKKMYPLHLAAVNGNSDIVNLLLEKQSRIDVVNSDGATPLHKACEHDHKSIIQILIEKDPNLVTMVDKNGRTACNLAAERGRHSVVKDLCERKVRNLSDKNGNTPLHVAAKKGDSELVTDLIGTKCDSQCRNKEGKTPLHIAAQFGHYEIVKALVKYRPTDVYACDGNKSSALHLAASQGHSQIVTFLMQSGADESKCDASNQTPFERSAESGNKETIKIFLKARPPTPDAMRSCLIRSAEKNYDDVVKMLLKPRYTNNIRKEDLQECLFAAIDRNNVNAVMAIIDSESWMVALDGCMIRTQDERLYCCKKHHRIIDTPMRRLIEKMPDVAEIVMTKCQNTSDDPSFERMKEKLIDGIEWPDYEGICCSDIQKLCSFRKLARAYKYNHPLMIMVREKRFKLLDHPLVVEQVKRKWKVVGRPIFYVRFLIYLAFVSVLTGFIEGTYAPYTHTLTCAELHSQGYMQNPAARYCRRGTYILAFVNLLIEVVERIFAVRSTLFQWGNFLETVTYIFSILFVWNFEHCQIDTGYRHEWQWNLGTASILLAWVNLVLNAQDHPKFGIYGVLVERLTTVFAKFFLVFMMFIIGFALTFRANLQNQPDFVTFWKSMVKTTAMMIGEFTFDDLYTTGEVHYRIVGHIIFFIFMIWMSIFIMNLLIGLAVANINEVFRRADETRQAMEVELILDIEKNLPTFLRKSLNKTSRKLSFRQQLVRILKFIKSYLQGTDEQDENQGNPSGNLQNDEMKEIKNKLTTLEQLMKKQKANTGTIGKLIKQQKAGDGNSKRAPYQLTDEPTINH